MDITDVYRLNCHIKIRLDAIFLLKYLLGLRSTTLHLALNFLFENKKTINGR